ncbi:serine dehydratase subunit alpha family protein [Alkalihalobacillus sp. AL-G]|uniref:L-cysteine desulfidase family protein n=1 Tax=Alkalihalobacillus sp. AL-G TaxID=2926399 RepID=UPI00272A9443|nr:L-serine ammonia-lyase, iron-sulfur-dependent, subunit alpha [Alkalihalobacillus sp. AL-G]WLD94741.1 L-serine ammonia-lyase, iron-sulfur-dependent, subunit alpha [Alkalihalobacillus sp. AL-G]
MREQSILDLLQKELVVAVGCTEPVAIALASATAKKYITDQVQNVEVLASGNVIKNAKSVGIPGTKTTGLDFAAALGIVAGDASKQLEVLADATSKDEENALKLLSEKKVTVSLADSSTKLFIEIKLYGENEYSRVIISEDHTNISLIEVNGETIYEQESVSKKKDDTTNTDESSLTIDSIFEFVKEVDVKHLALVQKSIELNFAIGEEGLKNEYGLNVGKTIQENVKKGILSDDLVSYSMSLASAGSDARMAGSLSPVMANSGSGNQGIAVTLPVVAVGKKLGVDKETMLRAVTLSHLITIHIKEKFGRLSALCGVTAAGMGASGAIVYLLGGELPHVKAAVQNTIGNVSGMICDGAKAGCAMKVSTCTSAAVQSAIMALNNKEIQSTDGFIHDDVEKSIENFCRLGNEGTNETDKLVLKMMLEK